MDIECVRVWAYRVLSAGREALVLSVLLEFSSSSLSPVFAEHGHPPLGRRFTEVRPYHTQTYQMHVISGAGYTCID